MLAAIKISIAEDALGAQRAFRARMDAQCEEIENYRLAVLRDEGRQLNMEQAAKEWIERFAEHFASEAQAS
jgi:hypothetical protein